MKTRNSLQVFLAVQKALFLRELKMRFSVSHTALFWTFFEPFIQVFLFILIKVFIFGRASENFDYAVFLALNFVAFNMFRNIIKKSMGAFSANKGLFLYKQVKPIDTIVARTIVEVFITSIILVIFIMIGIYFQNDMNVKNLLLVAGGYLWFILFSFSMGIMLAVANSFVQSVSKVVNVSMYVLLFASAVFYSLSMLSHELAEMLLYNPVVHFMEMIHGNYFYTLDDSYVDYTYMLLWTITPLYAGLWFYVRVEKKIVST